MTKMIPLVVLAISSAIAITGCTYTTTTSENNSKFTRRLVSSKTLDNGSALMIGARAPSDDNQCKLIATVPSSYNDDTMKGQFSIHMGDGVQTYLDKQAVDFANAHAGVNYAYIYIPTTHSHGFDSGSFSTSTTEDVTVTASYYSCKNPPKAHSNPFKD
jgi:hypothetical protein